APTLIGYGVRLGAAGAIAAAIGFAADWDHAGWACAACLLVMRPSPDLVTSRGVGRLVSVLLGAVVGVVLAELTGSGTVY
ncbi:FUSC family protein, partial [Klebsiella quasipneumoniae]|uniref:FUSC family protein n=1 Tax=Klebsiella quasipneumoniae TaxID=1463165 RepID=UPI00402B7375